MTAQPVITVQPLSVQVLHIEALDGETSLYTGSGFATSANGHIYIFSNWHIFSGRAHDTWQPLDKPAMRLPDHIYVTFFNKQNLTEKLGCKIPLLDANGMPSYFEHPDGHSVDVAAIQCDAIASQVQLFDLGLAAVDIVVHPAQPVSIVGYPAGVTTNLNWPIWKTGHIASEPELDWNDKPCFLIDATTRPGMSGSPVIAFSSGPYARSDKTMVISSSTPVKRFLGIYSGRVNDEAEVGRVWKPSAIADILQIV